MVTFKKKENKQLSKFFNSKEFECRCDSCEDQFVSEELLEKLDQVRTQFGKPIKVTSGYRCPKHNEKIGGAKNSSHVNGLAADIQPQILNLDDLDFLYEICYNIFNNIGDGRKNRFIHVDVRASKPTGKRHWIY